MYSIDCKKQFFIDLFLPTFGERLRELLNEGKKKVVYFKNEFDHSTFRYRCVNFKQALKYQDKYVLTYFLISEIPKILNRIDFIDIIVLQRAIWMPELEILINLAKKKGIKVIYDMDDLFFSEEAAINYINHIGYKFTESFVKRFLGLTLSHQLAAKKCDAFMATVPALANEIERYFNKPCFVVSNFLNNEQLKESNYVVNNRIQSEERFHIGYFSGSPSHLIDLRTIEIPLAELMKKYSDIDLVIVGYLDLSSGFLEEFEKQGRVIFKQFMPYEQLQYEIGKVDVNIAPLQKSPFNEAKSELKYFEAGIVKVPSVVSDTEIYCDVICDGVDGFVAKEHEWYQKLETLYLNKEFRNNMAEKAYKKATEVYTPKNMCAKICEIYDKLFNIKD